MIAFGLICFKPNDIWINFLSTFTKHPVYIIVDDNSIDYSNSYKEYTNINIIQIKNEDCITNGFIKLGFFDKQVTGWEKAVYYFSKINTAYDNVWLSEDDVFFNNEKTLCDIDDIYSHSDLLAATCGENLNGNKTEWHWPRINVKYPPPWYCSMCCIVRVSRELLTNITKYANTYNELFYLEAFFSTMCKHYNLKYDTPVELKEIVYKKDFKDNEINVKQLYHPVKDLNKHIYYRMLLNN